MTQGSFTDDGTLQKLFDKQRAHAPQVRATLAGHRIEKIRRLERELLAQRAEVQAALLADFRKPPQECDLTEIIPVISEIRYAAQHLPRWMAHKRVATPAKLPGYSSEIRFEPKGVVAIISPWNYPVNLTLGPLVGALCAGNCVILKPSELTPHTSRFLKKFLTGLFSEEEVAVLEGGADAAEALLRLPLDHVFFTGSPQVGKRVMKAASEHLTSVTLELGGKSPAVVDATADLAAAARKIAIAKFSNAGQTCIAPDYVLVESKVHDAFLSALAEAVETFYGPSAGRAKNVDFPRIVNDRHFHRVSGLMHSAVAAGAKLVFGGETDAGDRFIAPSALRDVPDTCALMQEEIFGPVLPVVRYETLRDAIAYINAKPNPLAAYVFSKNPTHIECMVSQTQAGGMCVNDALLHYLNPALPFGGNGNSGFGRAHGRESFLAFSNARAVLRQWAALPLMKILYPPYGTKMGGRMTDALLRYF